MQGIERKKTEDILIEAGLLSMSKLKEIKELELRTGEKIEKILLSDGIISNKEILNISAKKMGVEFVDLENVYVNKDAISSIKPQIAVKYCVLPFNVKNNLLSVAMQDPEDIFLIDEIKVFTQMEIKPFLADSKLLSRAIKYFYNDGNAEIVHSTDEEICTVEEQNVDKNNCDRVQPITAPIASEVYISVVDDLIKSIILNMIRLDCSDIHIDTINRNLRIRYKVDGTLIEDKLKHSISCEEFIARIKVLAGILICDPNVPQKGLINYDFNEKDRISFEVFVLPVAGGEKLLLKMERQVYSLNMEEIGMSEREKKQIVDILDKRRGMVIVTGLNCSGRTTTCYSMINKITSKDLNIMTIETKISQRIEGISQVQIQSNTDNSAMEFIESILVHDPDVLAVDIDINWALEASSIILKKLMGVALSGKLVIVTMNFPSTFETISGLINLGFDNYLVAASIQGIIAQHLVRKKCTACENKKNDLETFFDTSDEIHKKGKKEICKVCNDIGFRGKASIFEVFTMNKEYRKLIMKENNLELLEGRISSENSSLRNNCIRLINDNITTIEETIRIGIGKDILNF